MGKVKIGTGKSLLAASQDNGADVFRIIKCPQSIVELPEQRR